MQKRLALWATAAVCGAALCLPSAAQAQDRRHNVAITFSPIHLILPMLEVTGEGRISDQIGVAGVLGFGSVSLAPLDGRLSLLELGGQFRYYLIGSFEHGMQLGAEVQYLAALGSGSSSGTSFLANGTGLALGAFVGYKYTAPIGFTFDGQLGGQVYAVRASASGGGSSATSSGSDFGLLLNLNVGWAF